MRSRRGSALVATVLALAWIGAPRSVAGAQRVEVVATIEVDAIGPRSGASVRATLRRHLGELERCRGEDDALVRIGFAIAPSGAVIDPRPASDPDLDRDATECVIALLRGWQVPGHARSVTTVSWSLRLRARRESTDEEGGGDGQRAPLRACFCFSWVHGPDHGITCEPTRARCVAERRATDRDATECAPRELPACDH